MYFYIIDRILISIKLKKQKKKKLHLVLDLESGIPRHRYFKSI